MFQLQCCSAIPNEAFKEVANSQIKAEKITKNYELGKETDLTKVIMTQQVASIAFQLTLNVRNKVLSSYKSVLLCLRSGNCCLMSGIKSLSMSA